MVNTFNNLYLILLVFCLASVFIPALWTNMYNRHSELNILVPKCQHCGEKAEIEDNCKTLLENGTRINNMWKPDGCTLHNYTSYDFKQCLKRQSQRKGNKTNLLLFIGDSKTRQRYRTIKHLLLDTALDFIWHGKSEIYDDYETSTKVQFARQTTTSHVVSFLRNFPHNHNQPDLIILGVNYWEIVNAGRNNKIAVSDKYLEHYEKGVSDIAHALQKGFGNTDILWVMEGPVNFTTIKTRKYPNPHWLAAFKNYNLKFPHGKITPVEMYNNIALKVFENHYITVCKVFYPIGQMFLNNTMHSDGVHLSFQGLAIVQQVLANYLCNSVMDFTDGSCCRRKK